MSLKDRLLRPRPRPVEIDGEQFYVCSMTLGLAEQVDSMAEQPGQERATAALVLSRCVLEEDGKPVFDDENDAGLAAVPVDVALQLVQEIRKITKPPTVDAVKKD